MIRFPSAVRALLLALAATVARASAVDNTWDYSVQVSSVVQASPPKITLTWPAHVDGRAFGYTVHRKTPGAASWGRGTALPGSATSYVDTRVEPGRAYEYRIVKATKAYKGFGYITTGIRAPLTDARGKLLLLVDDTFSASLAPELARLEQDIAGDGWTVIRRDVRRSDPVPVIKHLIRSAYAADPANLKAVFLFGHIAVPYSGQFNPDGHPDHIGAWPADAYYADVDGTWTDHVVDYRQTLNADAADAARISNVPGDGKFDQTLLPSAVELQLGRVDLANMPGRAARGGPATFDAETELLRRYLDKDHAFRHRKTDTPRRAVLGDYFGLRGGEAFAASGFRGFAPLVGAAGIRNLNLEFDGRPGVWLPELARQEYLLGYGCGAGNYTTMAGIGNSNHYHDATTTEFVGHNARVVFNLLFGSWLGDWDHEDDFLRAPLLTDYGLVSIWSGRPHWFIHPLGQGETFGHVTQIAQNNDGHYETQINSAARRVHIALMGDPTLRLHPVVPAADLRGRVEGDAVALAWAPSTDTAILGYHVYRGASIRGPFARLTRSPIATTSFVDVRAARAAGHVYMVRAIKLEHTTSGSYENAAQGVFWSAAPEAREAIFAAANLPLSPRIAARVAGVNPLSPDAAPAAGSAPAAALTIASSGAASSRDGGSAPGEPAPGTAPAGPSAATGAHAPTATN